VKIRLMGRPALVEAWAAALEELFGVGFALYDVRGTTDVRAYFNIDDRLAREIWELQNPAPANRKAAGS
jgi:hypothetical protein